jgi:hypothetical protein
MPTAACVCANDATARVTTTGANGAPAVYCEPVAVNFDDTDGTAVASSACDGFDCGPHGACVAMNGNPTCQCEAGYAAIVTTTVTPATGATQTVLDCRRVSGKAPALPALPPVGQTTIPSSPHGDGGSSGMQNPPPPASGGAVGAGGDTSTSTPSGGGSTSTSPMNGATPEPARASDGGCNVGKAKAPPAVATLLLAFAAAAAARRKRRPPARP